LCSLEKHLQHRLWQDFLEGKAVRELVAERLSRTEEPRPYCRFFVFDGEEGQ
jgi:hypothetical protein